MSSLLMWVWRSAVLQFSLKSYSPDPLTFSSKAMTQLAEGVGFHLPFVLVEM